MKKRLLCLIIAITFFCCSDEMGGTNDETSSGISLFKPDGKPAVGAIIQFYVVGDTSRQFVHQTITDNSGIYFLNGIVSQSGNYNIWAKLDDSLVAMQDSVYIAPTNHFVKDDTLGKPGSITGIVGLQPGDPVQTVTVQALGTHIYSNVNEKGKFTLHTMAHGEYTLRLVTTLPEYTPTYFSVSAKSNVNDTILDTLWLIYAGIPIVTGISALYDTLHGIVTLSWNNASYNDFQDFLIYRDHYDSVNLSPNPIDNTVDTIYRDTIYNSSTIDPQDYRFKYRIAIRNNSQVNGRTYKFEDVKAISPEKVKTTFSFSTKHIRTGRLVNSGSVNDSIQIALLLKNKRRRISDVSWAVEHIDSIKQITNFDSLSSFNSDTLIYSWEDIGEYPIFTISKDDGGSIWVDTMKISIVADIPIAKASTTTPLLSANDTIRLYGNATEVFGKIVKWEWDVGNTGTFIETTPDSNIAQIAPSIGPKNFPILLKVTDEDGNIAVDSTHVAVMGKVADIDGNTYNTILIGEQEWTIENLRTTKFNDGASIPHVEEKIKWIGLTSSAYCYYDNDENNREKYGIMYNWYTVDTKKLAPEGWHVPSYLEYLELRNFLITNGYNWDGTTISDRVGKSMATKYGWKINKNPGNIGHDTLANNSSHFSGLPGGYRSGGEGDFIDQSIQCMWWTSTWTGESTADGRRLAYDGFYLGALPNANHSNGFYIRLVKNKN